MKDLIEMASEPLAPELAACRVSDPLPMIAHPLVHTVMPIPGLANRLLKQKREQLRQYAERGDWSSWVFTHERPYRLDALLQLISGELIPPLQIGPLMAEVWTDSENIHQHLADWGELFAEHGQDLMNDAERDKLANMPDRLTVYRGECNDGGWSWTLDRDTARFFATRGVHESTGEVTTGFVEKRHVLAYLDRRGEEEILVEHRAYVTNQLTELVK